MTRSEILTRWNGVSLAYLGDALLELKIRERLLRFGVTDTGRLSAAAQKLVCAGTQSALVDRLLPVLSEEEEDAYKMGRNHHHAAKPKHATLGEYSRATGMESLFGYLYCTGDDARIETLFSLAYDEMLETLKDRI